MSASADVLAQAKVEIDLGQVPEGKNVCLCLLNQRGSSEANKWLDYHQVAGEASVH